MVFSKKNYILILVSIALILLGFFLMQGGSSTDESFSYALFSSRRIVVAPMVSLMGFLLMIYAIMAKQPKKKDKTSQEQ